MKAMRSYTIIVQAAQKGEEVTKDELTLALIMANDMLTKTDFMVYKLKVFLRDYKKDSLDSFFTKIGSIAANVVKGPDKYLTEIINQPKSNKYEV